MQNSDFPNLFIIGAPKCGTTSLFRSLADHPQVCASRPKETWFFAGNELDYMSTRPNRKTHEVTDYLQMFDSVSADTRVKMEGSTHYLYSEQALDFISETVPRPRILVLLRDPALRIWSHYNFINQKSEPALSMRFPEFVDTLLRGQGSCRFSGSGFYQYLLKNQLSYSNYADHLAPWMQRIPGEDIRILTLENLRQRHRETVADIAAWIGIESTFYTDYKISVSNAGRTRQAERTRQNIRKMAGFLPPAVKSWGGRMVDGLQKNSRVLRSADDQEAIDRLSEHFVEPNRQLGKLVGSGIAGWQ